MRTRRPDLDDDDDAGIARDGEVLRCGMVFMDKRAIASTVFDARAHQPGYRGSPAPEVRDARQAARSSREVWLRDMQSAWRRPARDDNEWLFNDPNVDPNLSLVRRGQPDPPDESERMRGHLYGPGELDALASEVARRREREHAARSRDLQQAWMSPGARAAAVEAQRRQVTNEAS
jgi:hypothetical protein